MSQRNGFVHHVICSCGNQVRVFDEKQSICKNCGATVWVTENRNASNEIIEIVPHVKNPKQNVLPVYADSVPYFGDW